MHFWGEMKTPGFCSPAAGVVIMFIHVGTFQYVLLCACSAVKCSNQQSPTMLSQRFTKAFNIIIKYWPNSYGDAVRARVAVRCVPRGGHAQLRLLMNHTFIWASHCLCLWTVRDAFFFLVPHRPAANANSGVSMGTKKIYISAHTQHQSQRV